ncbi:MULTISPECIES: Crp/Fnr family transcriptional regulator [Enterococcus]|uniref:Crp/Fnr family transcriptional regulator n=1 Tax=Enterococcus TaxID=1350 RepID=UPI00065E26C7|nr:MULTISPECIES: Crp/Fnr family transcriptional regulator [Enterococcus]
MEDMKVRQKEVSEKLPVLKEINEAFLTLVWENALCINVPKGGKVIYQEDSCQVVPFLIRGNIRKYKISNDGKEFTLFHIEPGEFCFFSAACSMYQKDFPVFSEIEEGSLIFSLPREIFKKLLADEAWQKYVSQIFSKKIFELMTTVSEVVFDSMPQRIAKYLLHNNKKNFVQTTHERIALELGSAREVVTRILRDFQKIGVLALSRGKIQVIEVTGLERIAQGEKLSLH